MSELEPPVRINKRPLTLEFVEEFLGNKTETEFYYNECLCYHDKFNKGKVLNKLITEENFLLRQQVEDKNFELTETIKKYNAELKDARQRNNDLFDKLRQSQEENTKVYEQFYDCRRSERNTNRMFYEKDRQNNLLKEIVKKLEEKIKVFEEKEGNNKRKRNEI